MSDSEAELAKQAEEQQIKILSEEENTRLAGGSEAAGYSDGEDTLTVIPCQETSTPCAEPFTASEFLSTLSFSQSQEADIQEVVRLSEGSRERVLERLWERAVARLLADEAKQILREAKPDKQ